jgi:carboxyl-terminal processing protease
MTYNNSKFSIYTPIVLAVVLAVGVFIGNRLSIVSYHGNLMASGSNKLDALMGYIQGNYVDTLSEDQIIEKTIPELLKNLDPHSVYIPAKDLQAANEPLEGSFGGIGVQFNIQNDTVLVIDVISGGPSERKGIKPGDRIVAVNDSVMVGKKLTTDLVMRKLKGKIGTEVKVGIVRRGIREMINYDIIRGEIPLYSVDVAYMINQDIGYIKISKFARTTHQEFLDAVAKLRKKGLKKVIVDLRSNGGGYLDAARDLAGEFLSKGKLIVYTQGKSHARKDYKASHDGVCMNDSLIVLIDSYSASASEIFAGAMQDNDRGIIIGRRSFGKGLVQEPIMFKDGSAIRLTVARYYTPTGRCIQKPYTNGYNEYEEDIQLRMAHHELEVADSIKFNKSQKFKTPKGKIVYGGGGIAPDIFVPVDTSGYSKFYEKLTIKGTIYQFALDYADRHRPVLKNFKDYKEIINYLDQQNFFEEFMAYSKKKGITPAGRDLEISKVVIDTQLKAYVARNFLDNDGFYPILQNIDNVVKKAVEVINKRERV